MELFFCSYGDCQHSVTGVVTAGMVLTWGLDWTLLSSFPFPLNCFKLRASSFWPMSLSQQVQLLFCCVEN